MLYTSKRLWKMRKFRIFELTLPASLFILEPNIFWKKWKFSCRIFLSIWLFRLNNRFFLCIYRWKADICFFFCLLSLFFFSLLRTLARWFFGLGWCSRDILMFLWFNFALGFSWNLYSWWCIMNINLFCNL